MVERFELVVSGSDFVDVGAASEFEGRSRRIVVAGRSVAVFSHGGRFFALDANCYHSAGRLEEVGPAAPAGNLSQHAGDIEDVNGEPCVRCPLHKYIISLSSGHSFYEAVAVHRRPAGPPIIESLGFKSKGPRQRCHRVEVRHGRLLIQLGGGPPLDSDRYAFL
ncbi:rieske [2fe-2s] domain-containing protein [Babesia caballi]|uniref:Rieske [2fe-2s] domain-containing protein n=1 Tax=Babesia caballi TaxID=5871 RepID=A0AAV4M1L5_BABCB|nr:rieske [2fe-2s] domain-containing protein [Babesia caballi]